MTSLAKKIIIRGEILAKTGLHIGGTNNEMSIGGMQNGVIRHPVTQKPYIPGSSLKGKMRSLTELTAGDLGGDMGRHIQTGPSNDPSKLAARLFGYTQYKGGGKDEQGNDYKQQQPSRLIVRDCFIINEEELRGEFVEEKTETVIDRITSAAMPRPIERVPANARFALELVLNVFAGEDEEEYLQGVFNALRLVQDDYLGGAGSRGSGQVGFQINAIEHRSAEYYRGDQQAIQQLSAEQLTKYTYHLNGRNNG